MTKKQYAANPSTPASEGVPCRNSLRSGVVDQPTPRALPIAEVLGPLQAQAEDVMRSSMFDDDVTTETTPVMKRMRSEIGTAAVRAQRHESDLHARVAYRSALR
jgi:hypothetical protein